MARLVKDAIRSLIRTPGFSLTYVVTLALGVGLNGAMFAVVHGVLVRPLQNAEAGRLIYLQQAARGIGFDNIRFSVPEIEDYRKTSRTIEALGGFSTMSMSVVGLGEPQQLRAGIVGGDYFNVIGLRPKLGRLLDRGDDGSSAAGAVVLTYKFWQSLGADASVVGRAVRVGNRAATVVGVLEPAPAYPEDTEIIVNTVTSPHHLSATMVTDRKHRMTDLFGRLARGQSLEAAQRELDVLLSAQIAANPGDYEKAGQFAIRAVPLKRQMTARARTVLFLLLGTSGLVLLFACANVANLLVARNLHLQHELSIRASMGAGRWSLRAGLLAETFLLSAVGGLISLVVAFPMARLASQYAERFTVLAANLPFESWLIWYGVATSFAAALLVSCLVPLPPQGALTRTLTTRSPAPSVATRRLQGALVAAQVALSVMLMATAALFLRSLMALQAVDSGMHAARVLALDVPIVPGRRLAEVESLYRDIERQLAALPGVEAAGIGSTIPLREDGGFLNNLEFTAEGLRDEPDRRPRGNFRAISPGYLTALGIPVLSGRAFTTDDRNDSEDVVLVNRAIVDLVFSGKDPVGRFLTWTDPRMKFGGVSTTPRRIVGVVGDVRELGLEQPVALTVYHPFAQEPHGGRVFVRTRQDPHSAERAITSTIRDLAVEQPIVVTGTVEEIRESRIAPSRVTASLMVGLGALALAIGVVGVFGLLNYSVATRVREFGIRMAIGSTSSRILAAVMQEGLILCGVGLVAGLAGSVVIARLLASMMFGTGGTDPVPFGLAAVIMLLAAALAAAIPARRACRVDPCVALRSE